MESAGLSVLERVVDLRPLRLRGFGHSRAAIAHRSVHSGGKAFSPTSRSYFTALELDLPALAPARFVLSSF